jgi:hypothetical protein
MALHEVDKPMNPRLRVSLDKQVNVFSHAYHYYSDITLAADFRNDAVEQLIDAIDKDFAPIF